MRRRMLLEGGLKFNQLVNKDDFPTTGVRQGFTFTNNGDGSFTIDGTGTGSFAITVIPNFNFIAQHKYLYYGAPSQQVVTSVVRNRVDTNWTPDGSVLWESSGSGTYTRVYVQLYKNTIMDNVTSIPLLIDLTAMYGAGNEPTTVEQVKADCAAIGHPLTECQPYTPIT